MLKAKIIIQLRLHDDIVVEDTQKQKKSLFQKEEPTEEDNEESIENND